MVKSLGGYASICIIHASNSVNFLLMRSLVQRKQRLPSLVKRAYASLHSIRFLQTLCKKSGDASLNLVGILNICLLGLHERQDIERRIKDQFMFSFLFSICTITIL